MFFDPNLLITIAQHHTSKALVEGERIGATTQHGHRQCAYLRVCQRLTQIVGRANLSEVAGRAANAPGGVACQWFVFAPIDHADSALMNWERRYGFRGRPF
jgi:hypothetical protein